MLHELTLSIEEARAEALADALLDAGALSVAIEDALADTESEQPLYGEPGLEPSSRAWTLSRLRVLVESEKTPAIFAAATQAFGAALPPIEATAELGATDWVRATQSQFPPIAIGTRLWIVPSWHAAPADAQIVIRLDPGVAFGTGSHPTTRLCLRWLEARNLEGARVLDYGCGSGILSIAAARLGAAEVSGCDIDAQALVAAQANARANEVAGRYTEPSSLPAGSYDIVLANILSNPLKLLAPALLARVAPYGALVLSGILERQTDELIAAFAAHDPALPLSVWGADDGWVCLAGERRA